MKMIKKAVILLLFPLLAGIIGGCATAAETPPARVLPLETLGTQPGFAWFDVEVEQYLPNAAMVAELNARISSGNFRCYMFVNPSCSCIGTQQLFPHTFRILRDAGLPASRIAAFGMARPEAAHPRSEFMVVRQLPTIYFTTVEAGQERIIGTIYDLPEGNTRLEEVILNIFR